MENIDHLLFVFINTTLSNPLFDAFFPFLTDLHKNSIFARVIVPLFLALWIYRKKWQVLPVLIGASLCIGAVDNFTYRVLKPAIKRQRPPAVESVIQLRTGRYAGYSFPSNHAANNFAGATFLSYCYPALSPIFYAVASLVAFSRIYVGVHYPGDVVAGSLIGVIFGLFFFRLWSIILVSAAKRWPSLQGAIQPFQGDRNEDQQRKPKNQNS